MASHIYLLRHGETEWTISGRHTGVTDVTLTPHGEDEARAMGARLKTVSFQHVLSSPRQRAQKTCALAGFKSGVSVNDDLREWNYGDYEGLLTRDILARRPGWKIFDDGCPNGESPADVAARADRLLTAVRKLDGNVALFSHGHFTRVLAARWVEMPVSAAHILASSTGSISVLAESANGPRPVIALWNSAPKLP
jgi:probable phosphoglycerate mutase